MSRSLAVLLAWSVFVLSLVLCALGLVFLALNRSHPGGPTYELALQGAVIVVAWSTVGVLIASRRPAHPIGWLFSALGLSSGVQLFCGEYAIYALVVERGALLGGGVSVWITCWLWVQTNVLVAFMALLFPDGNCRRLAGEPLCGSTESWPWRGALRPRSCPGRALLSRP
jgi:hypothetical protein